MAQAWRRVDAGLLHRVIHGQPGVPPAPGADADPVGAGDAFTAALAHHLVRGHAPDRAARAANRYGAFVASRPGAMPEVPDAIRAEVTARARG